RPPPPPAPLFPYTTLFRSHVLALDAEEHAIGFVVPRDRSLLADRELRRDSRGVRGDFDPHGLLASGDSRECNQRILPLRERIGVDRKSTRLNSSHLGISYA